MSKKIVFDDNLKKEMLDFINSTYQCSIKDVSEKFGVSPHAIRNNFDKDFLHSVLYYGCKDSTKQKLHDFNVGKVHTEEQKQKTSESVKKAFSKRTKESWEQAYEKARQTKSSKYGSWEEYRKHQTEKTKKTKLERYGDENYNNLEQGKNTKLERYGNENYNNASKIVSTHIEKYGDIGYNASYGKKRESTMLEKYGVIHNWSSKDPKLNGQETRNNLFGGKEFYYKFVSQKTKQTNLDKYGVPCTLMLQKARDAVKTAETQQRRIDSLRKNNTFHQSLPEQEVYRMLVLIYGKDDVFQEYQDDRYSFNGYKFKCDFYIKSIDTFIELNLYPTHGSHPYNEDDIFDRTLRDYLVSNETNFNKTFLDVWCNRDVKKAFVAQNNNLNYVRIYKDNYENFIEKLTAEANTK